jgi:solute carrier family 13 (sodium-dependent dicarboxylate transporter), member 2/3/5
MNVRTCLHGAIAILLAVGVAIWFPLQTSIVESFQLQTDRVRLGLALLALAAYLWLTEAIPIPTTALLIPVFACFLLKVPVEAALAPFADPIIFLFLGGFVIAGTLSKHQIDHWIATQLIRLSKGHFVIAAISLILTTALISMWISNTATAAMMLPLGLGLASQIQVGAADKQRAEWFLLLGIAFAASIGGVGSIVGTPPNGITAKQLGLDFTGWLKYGLPALAVLLPTMLIVLLAWFRPSWQWRVTLPSSAFSWTRPRRLALAVFLLAVVCWLGSSALAKLCGVTKGFDTLIALGATVLISLLRLLDWKELESSIEWGVLLLFGGGLALGKILEDTGTSLYLARWFTQLSAGLPLPLLLLALIATITLLSEFASNTAVATLMVPIFAKVALEMGLPPEKLVIPVGLAASCGFMLPVATPPNALVYGTGRIPQRVMIGSGFALDLACINAITLLCWLVF